MSDEDIQELENQLPPISGQAFAQARQRALSFGLSVLETEDGFIYEVFPDGRKQIVKQIEPPVYVEPGSKFTIR